MPKISVICTALPNGIIGEPANRRLQLSAYVSLRLQPDEGGTGRLGQFPAVLNWPAQMQPDQVDFLVQASGGPATKAAVISAPPDPVRWAALFSGETLVSRAHSRQVYAATF